MSDGEDFGDPDGEKPETDYEVGYKKPPKSGEFKTGHPKLGGRKKGTPNMKTIVERELLETVVVPTKDGKKTRASKLSLLVKTQTAKAISKQDTKAAAVVLKLAEKYILAEPEADPEGLSDDEKAVLASHVAIEKLITGGKP